MAVRQINGTAHSASSLLTYCESQDYLVSDMDRRDMKITEKMKKTAIMTLKNKGKGIVKMHQTFRFWGQKLCFEV